MQRIHYEGVIENTLESIDLLYLHKYFYGGVTTFTAHLFYKMGLDKMNKPILHFSIKNEKKLRDFGYDIKYKNITLDHLLEKKDLLITVIKDNFFQVISELEEKTSSKKNSWSSMIQEIYPIV